MWMSFFDAKRAHGWVSHDCEPRSALRAFFLHAEGRGWCAQNWQRNSKTRPAQIRTHSQRSHMEKMSGESSGSTGRLRRRLCAVTPSYCFVPFMPYAAARSRALRLSDLTGARKRFASNVRSAAGIKRYPLQYEVGEAILRYLTKGRPRCTCRNVFVPSANLPSAECGCHVANREPALRAVRN